MPCSRMANARSSQESLESMESLEKLESPESMENTSHKKMKTESDSEKSGHNTAWEKTKEVGENVKEGIAKSFEKAIESVQSCVKPGQHDADGGDEYGDGGDDDIDGGKISVIPENVATTKTWNDIKNRADDALEESKEYPGVHLVIKNDPGIHKGTNEVFDSGLLEPQHTFYDTFADGANLEHSKQFSGVDNIPESVKMDEQKSAISDEDLVSTGLDENKSPENTLLPEKCPNIALSEEKMESVRKDLDKIYLTEQKMVSAKRDLDKILNYTDERGHISYGDIEGASAADENKSITSTTSVKSAELVCNASDDDKFAKKEGLHVKFEDENALTGSTATGKGAETSDSGFESDISGNISQQGNGPNVTGTEQKMESVKKDLDKILKTVDEKFKISKKDIEEGYVVNDKKIAIKNDLQDARDSVKGITKSVKEVKDKCESASEKLKSAEFMVSGMTE